MFWVGVRLWGDSGGSQRLPILALLGSGTRLLYLGRGPSDSMSRLECLMADDAVTLEASLPRHMGVAPSNLTPAGP
jgi:hypothetical protein